MAGPVVIVGSDGVSGMAVPPAWPGSVAWAASLGLHLALAVLMLAPASVDRLRPGGGSLTLLERLPDGLGATREAPAIPPGRRPGMATDGPGQTDWSGTDTASPGGRREPGPRWPGAPSPTSARPSVVSDGEGRPADDTSPPDDEDNDPGVHRIHDSLSLDTLPQVPVGRLSAMIQRDPMNARMTIELTIGRDGQILGFEVLSGDGDSRFGLVLNAWIRVEQFEPPLSRGRAVVARLRVRLVARTDGPGAASLEVDPVYTGRPIAVPSPR
jgi:hypothetical protein